MSDLKPFVLDFDLLTGHCDSGKVQPSCRRVSNLLTQFADEEAAKKLIAEGDPLLYEFYELELPEEPGVLRFGSTRLYPGKVGNEYFMTKGPVSYTHLDVYKRQPALCRLWTTRA